MFTIKPGDVLANKYVVERRLGLGGMGVVVAARHVTVQHRVALKFLLPGATSSRVAGARFLREARAATALQSEHVVRVMDLGTLDTGAPYLVMEYLEGMDLARLLVHKGALHPADAVGYVLQALVGIAEAHALGIVHRDLKPSNIFLTERSDGSPLIKVLDFGISKAMSADAGHESLTRSGRMIGSPSYMAPEQIRSSKQVDTRADIWSLGVILHELVTGKPPFIAEQISGVLAAIVADRPTSPRAIVDSLPRGLELVILKCLEKDPRDRYQTARELAEALAPFASLSAQGLVARIVAITLRKGQLTLETRVEGPPSELGPARPASPTGAAWSKSLSLGTGRFGVRMAIGALTLALLAAAFVALRGGSAREDERVLAPAVSHVPARVSEHVAERSQALADPAVAPTPAASHASFPIVTPASSSAALKRKRVPRSLSAESAGSGKTPRAVSDIVLDRR